MESELKYGTSKYRRWQLRSGLDELKEVVKLFSYDAENLSQLQVLHFVSKFLFGEKILRSLTLNSVCGEHLIFENNNILIIVVFLPEQEARI
jgi:hypothetical protein